MTDERRRITWSEMNHGSLDPFLVDRRGHVFKKKKGEAAKPAASLSLKQAAATWQKEGFTEPWTDQDPSQPHPNRRRRRPVTKPNHLLKGVNETAWVYYDQWPQDTWKNSKGKLVARFLPKENFLIATGDREVGWYVLTVENRFRTIFHGPSMALHTFFDMNPTI